MNFTEFPNNSQLDSFGVGQTGYAISDVEFVQFSVGRFAKPISLNVYFSGSRQALANASLGVPVIFIKGESWIERRRDRKDSAMK